MLLRKEQNSSFDGVEEIHGIMKDIKKITSAFEGSILIVSKIIIRRCCCFYGVGIFRKQFP